MSTGKCDRGKKEKESKKLGTTFKKDDNFGEWYSEVVVKGEMIEYYDDVSGCYILMPCAMEIWERLKEFFDGEIKKMKVKPYYFPLFVTENVLQKEKDHIEGFAPEVAWVTKSRKSELEAPIVDRPTSRTVMYPYFSKWIKSHRAYLSGATSGAMLSDGSLAIQLRSSGAVSFFGKKGIGLLPRKGRQLKRYSRYWNSIEGSMRTF